MCPKRLILCGEQTLTHSSCAVLRNICFILDRTTRRLTCYQLKKVGTSYWHVCNQAPNHGNIIKATCPPYNQVQVTLNTGNNSVVMVTRDSNCSPHELFVIPHNVTMKCKPLSRQVCCVISCGVILIRMYRDGERMTEEFPSLLEQMQLASSFTDTTSILSAEPIRFVII